MSIGLLTIHLSLPECTSLKEKRRQVKPILARLHREFNVSSAELDLQDRWQECVIGCTTISNDAAQNQRLLQQVLEFTARNWPDLPILDHRIEII